MREQKAFLPLHYHLRLENDTERVLFLFVKMLFPNSNTNKSSNLTKFVHFRVGVYTGRKKGRETKTTKKREKKKIRFLGIEGKRSTKVTTQSLVTGQQFLPLIKSTPHKVQHTHIFSFFSVCPA
jgi:hypothetical protein